jgi:hypothetical protein
MDTNTRRVRHGEVQVTKMGERAAKAAHMRAAGPRGRKSVLEDCIELNCIDITPPGAYLTTRATVTAHFHSRPSQLRNDTLTRSEKSPKRSLRAILDLFTLHPL